MAKIDDLFDVIETQTKQLEDLTNAMVVISKNIDKPTPAPKIPAPKPDPRINDLMAQVAELREMVQRANTPPPSTGSSNSDKTLFFFVVGGAFVVCLLASMVSGFFMSYKPIHDGIYTIETPQSPSHSAIKYSKSYDLEHKRQAEEAAKKKAVQ